MRELYVDTREGAACFRTISEAVASLPSENEELTVIHVAPGIYEERLRRAADTCDRESRSL